MSKHTPGPWSYWPNCTREGGMVTQDATATHVAAPTVYATPGITEANALLIAAAPELLDALQSSLDHIVAVQGHNDGGIQAHIRAAIAKATGA